MEVGQHTPLKELKPGEFFRSSTGHGLFVFLSHLPEGEVAFMVVEDANAHESPLETQFRTVICNPTFGVMFLGRMNSDDC